MYKLLLINRKGFIEKEREIGHWLDHAREEFARIRNALARTDLELRLELVEVVVHNYETILEHDQRWGKGEQS